MDMPFLSRYFPRRMPTSQRGILNTLLAYHIAYGAVSAIAILLTLIAFYKILPVMWLTLPDPSLLDLPAIRAPYSEASILLLIAGPLILFATHLHSNCESWRGYLEGYLDGKNALYRQREAKYEQALARRREKRRQAIT